MIICMPLLAFTPEGLYSEDGWFNFISDGFRKHPWQATVLFSTAETCIGFVRLVGILLFVDQGRAVISWKTKVCILLLPITIIASIMTIQINAAPDYHIVYAVIWIGSSALFHLLVTSFNPAFQKHVPWVVGAASKLLVSTAILVGIVFGGFAITGRMDQDRDSRRTAGILEYITAESLAVNDLLLNLVLFWTA
jgi:hypothetical protein